MTPSERDLLCTWAKLVHKFEVKYCRQREDFKSYNKSESFEAVGLGLAHSQFYEFLSGLVGLAKILLARPLLIMTM